MTFRLSIWYATTPDSVAPQTFDLTADQVYAYVNPEVGFVSDMLNLKGEGVRKLMLEVVR